MTVFIILVTLLLAAGSVVLAFLGADSAGEIMRSTPVLAAGWILAAVFACIAVRALWRKRFVSALIHAGVILILAGALCGTQKETLGFVAMVSGEESDVLWDKTFTQRVGRLPFVLHLDSFEVNRYPATKADLENGFEPPVREYVSRVRIGDAPEKINIRVNQPLRRDGWMVYQMSWGESPSIRTGETVRYTVLQCSKDRGLYWTYGGFAVCLAGILLFKIRSFKQI